MVTVATRAIDERRKDMVDGEEEDSIGMNG